MGRIVVVGSSNTDMVVNSPVLPVPGETILGGDFNIHAGGKGANQAVAAARAEAEVTFIAKVGKDDFGQNAIKGYQEDQINTDHIFVDANTPSGIAVILVENTSGQNSIVVAPGANNKLTVENIESCELVISAADYLLVQLEIPLESVSSSLKIAKNNKVKTILNPAPAQELNSEILSMVDVFTPNETETHAITGIELKNDDDIKKAAEKLLETVNDAVIITLGSRGVYYLTREKEGGFIPTLKVAAVDTTAAGDVFNGYLAASLASGFTMKKAIEDSNKAATISVTRNGAQPSIPHLTEVKKG